jgi:hypothetical protein
MALAALAWALAGELLGAAVAPRFLAAAIVTLQPGVTNLEGAVNPDLLLFVLWTAGLLLMLRLVRLGPSVGRFAALAAVLAAGGLTNGRGLFMLVPAVAALLAMWRRHGSPRPEVWWGVTGATAVAVVAGFYVALTRPVTAPFVEATPGGLFSYVWQFYLPRLPGMSHAPGPDYGVRDAFVARVWGGFAQLEVEIPSWAVTLLLILSVAVVVALAATLWQRRATVDGGRLAVCVAALVGLLAGLHLIAYRSLLTNAADPVIAGRYVLVLVALGAVAVAAVVRSVPARWSAPLAGIVLGGAVVAQLNGLGLLIDRFWN